MNAETARAPLTVWVTPGCGSSAWEPNSLPLQRPHVSPESAAVVPSGRLLPRTLKTKRTFWIHRSPRGSASRTRPRCRGTAASETCSVIALWSGQDFPSCSPESSEPLSGPHQRWSANANSCCTITCIIRFLKLNHCLPLSSSDIHAALLCHFMMFVFFFFFNSLHYLYLWNIYLTPSSNKVCHFKVRK